MSARATTAVDRLTPLRQAAVWRLYLLVALLGVCVTLHARSGFRLNPTVAYMYAMIGVAFVASAMLYLWLRGETAAPPALTALTLLADLVVITALAASSGGVDSIFGVLYMVLILEGAALSGMQGSLGTATAASLAYLFVAVLDSAGAFTQTEYLRIGAADPVKADLWVFAGLRVFAFYLVALLSGVLARRIGHLEREQARLLENFATGYLAADREGRLTFLNSAGRRILGCGFRPVLGMPVTDLFCTGSTGGNPVDLSLRLHKEFYEWQCLHEREDGKTVPLNVTTALIRRAGHEVGGVMAHFSDETLVQELEETLRQQDRLALAGELSASLAHEVRNPVAAIRSAAQELGPQAAAAEDPVETQLLNIIVRESDQLNRVVTHFLEYAGVSAQEQLPVDAGQLLDEVVTLLRREPERMTGIVVQTHYETNGGRVLADVGLLKEAFLNLVQNAVEAMPEGGTLQLSTVPVPRAGHLEVVIADTGTGISAADLPRVFQPFFTTKRTGTGLGLAIVHRIIQAHHGDIRVESPAAGGTHVRVCLPMDE